MADIRGEIWYETDRNPYEWTWWDRFLDTEAWYRLSMAAGVVAGLVVGLTIGVLLILAARWALPLPGALSAR